MNNVIDDVRILHNQNSCEITYDAIIESCDGEHYTMSLTDREEREAIKKAVNQGIDSRLQACFFASNGDSYKAGERSFIATEDGVKWKKGEKVVYGNTLECTVSPESLPVLIRRLFESEKGESLAGDILDTLGFDELGKFHPNDDD